MAGRIAKCSADTYPKLQVGEDDDHMPGVKPGTRSIEDSD